MPELTTEEKQSILLINIRVARENLYTAEIHDSEQEIIDDLQAKVDSLEAKYTEEFGE
jgi:hypothetical protein